MGLGGRSLGRSLGGGVWCEFGGFLSGMGWADGRRGAAGLMDGCCTFLVRDRERDFD